jgi:hypothetical protein
MTDSPATVAFVCSVSRTAMTAENGRPAGRMDALAAADTIDRVPEDPVSDRRNQGGDQSLWIADDKRAEAVTGRVAEFRSVTPSPALEFGRCPPRGC